MIAITHDPPTSPNVSRYEIFPEKASVVLKSLECRKRPDTDSYLDILTLLIIGMEYLSLPIPLDRSAALETPPGLPSTKGHSNQQTGLPIELKVGISEGCGWVICGTEYLDTWTCCDGYELDDDQICPNCSRPKRG